MINRLLELETIEPLTAILLTRSLLKKFYWNSSYPRWILCCSARLCVLGGLFFIGFGVGAHIIHPLDPIFYQHFCHFEDIDALSLTKITLDLLGI